MSRRSFPRAPRHTAPQHTAPRPTARRTGLALLATAGVLVPMSAAVLVGAAGAATTGTSYAPGTPTLATITNGTSAAPWNLSQGDPDSPAYSSVGTGTVLPSYTPGGATTTGGGPNLAVYPAAGSGTDGTAPYPSGTVGTPGPLAGYCGTGDATTAAAGTPARQPAGTTLPLAPAYFPHIVRNADGSLTGYFDYRPKDTDEAIVAARSTDEGRDWTYEGEALEQNPGSCPSADTNDDGQGHPNVLTVGGVSRLYTLQRPAGDNVGVGMLVHTLTPTATDPLAGLPPAEEVGIDPDGFATAGVPVPTTGGTPASIAVSQTGAAGSPEQLLPGKFVDLTVTPTPTASSVITCTGVGTNTLTGCTAAAAGGLTVAPHDLIEQVIGTASASATVPAGPNTTTGDGGLASLGVTFVTQVTAAILNANAPNRVYIDGVPVYCAQSNANPTNKIENCTTGPGGAPLTVASGDPITSDPVVPATATQTSGLVSPDGIVGVLPGYPGTPQGATAVMYTEKILNYFVAGTTTNSKSATFAASSTITFTPSASEGQDMPATVSVGSPVTVDMGDITTGTIVPVTCTGLTTGTTDSLTGCTTTANPTDSYNATSLIGAPGATTVSSATLNETGEGAGAAPSAKNVAKLLKNNEDLTVLRVAWTTDGVTFSSAGLDNGGVISGASDGATDYSDINNPSSTTSPSNLNAYATPGTADATEMRFVGSAGSIITNPDGSDGMFLSGAWGADGDSDAFNQIFYTSSTDGEHWSVPVSVVSTDYTFAASIAQQGTTQPLGISAYYSGRAYGPSVVQNPDGTLTMVFAGYRLPKPITNAGTVLGTGAQQYTVGGDDPALYRNILVETLTTSTSPAVTTQTSLAASTTTPVVGQPVTYTATVAPVAPGTGTPTGTVTFTGSSGVLCATTLDESATDQATCTTAYGAPGSDAVTAAYGGDANYATSSAGPLDVTIGRAATTLTLGAAPAPSVTGQAVVFTATVSPVTPAAGVVLGTVAFAVTTGTGTALPCTSNAQSTLVNGKATCTVAAAKLTAAESPLSVSASFAGTASYGPSQDTVAQDVDPASTVVTLTSGDNPSPSGRPVTFTATVAVVAPGSGKPGGSVTFSFAPAGTLACARGDTVTLTASAKKVTCKLARATLTAPVTVTATYGGSPSDNGASASVDQNVRP